MSRAVVGALTACILTIVPGMARAEQGDTLSVDAALAQPAFPYLMPISISPDGGAVAYTVCASGLAAKEPWTGGYLRSGTTGMARGCSVWITKTTGTTSIRVGGGAGSNAWAPQWSPDGKKLAFYSDQNGVARLWIWILATQSSTPVSNAIVRPYAPLEVPRWTPDSRGVVTRILPYGEPVASAGLTPEPAAVSWDTVGRQPGSTVRVYRTDSAWRAQPRYLPPVASQSDAAYTADIALVHVENGVVQTLARGYKPYSYWVSPDGKFVALTSERGLTSAPVAGGGEYTDDLIIAPIDSNGTGAAHVIAQQASISPFGTGVSWAPDGRTLVYATEDSDRAELYHVVRTGDWSEKTLSPPESIRASLKGRDFAQPLRWGAAGKTLFVATGSLVATVDVTTGSWRALSRPPHGVSIVALVGPESRSDLWEPDGARLVVQSRNDSTKQMGFATINLRTGSWAQATDKPQYLGSARFAPSDVAANGREVAYMSESATKPADVWIAGRDLRDARQITAVAASLATPRYGESRLIAWTTAEGKKVSGALLLPAGYQPGHRYPLIVYPYPTSLRSNDVYRFGLDGVGVENMQLFATRGYAVLAPDAPIILSDQMRSLADVLLSGVDRAVAIGVADSNRLGVMGHSWGGYTVLALLVQTHRFRAAVMRGGVGDLFDMYGEIQPTGSSYGQIDMETWFGTSPWRDLPRYIDNSPVFFLDRVRTPLLIVHGGQDATVPPHNGSLIFADLRRLGQTVEYAAYDGENHGEIGWTIANQRDYLSRLLGWFGEYVGPRARDRGKDENTRNTAP